MKKKLVLLPLLCLFLTASMAEAQWQQAIQRAVQQRQSAQQQQSVQQAPSQQGTSRTIDAPAMPSGNVSGNAGRFDFKITVAPNAELTHARNHVLLIGVTEYPKAVPSEDALQMVKSLDLGNLSFAVKDMEGMKEALVQARFCREGDIRILREPTAREAETALRNMLQNVQRGDRVLVAFSGHGISLSEGERTMDFLCFTDAKTTYNTETRRYTTEGLIARSTLEEWLDASDADLKLVFIDACRNVPDIGDIRGASGFGIGDSGDIRNQGFFRFSSCKPGEVSWEFDNKEHSIFTYFLIEGMTGKADKHGRGVITLADLQEYVVNETAKFVRDNNKSTTQTPAPYGSPDPRITASHVNFSFVSTAEENRQAALRILDEDIRRLEQYTTSPAYQTIQAARRALNVSFTQQGYQNVVMMIADLRMQIEYNIAVEEWLQLNPPPQLRRQNRDGMRRAGAIAAIAMNYAGVSGGGYVQMGTQLGASALEQRDQTILRQQQAQRERRIELMHEQLAVYTAETGSPFGFVQSVPERRASNSATLDELGKQINLYRNQQGGSTLANEVNTLRNSNSRSNDAASLVAVTSQIADLRQRIENFVTEKEAQRLANEAKLADLEEWLAEHQNQSQTYRNLASRITSLRTSNDRGSDVTSQVLALEQDIERFIAAPNQPAQQQRPPAQPRRRLLR